MQSVATTVRRILRLAWKPIGATLILAGLLLLLLAKSADDVTENGGITRLDQPLADAVTTIRTGGLTTIMSAISTVSEPVIVMALAVVAAIAIWAITRDRYAAGALIVAVTLGAAASYVGKAVFARTRPPALLGVTPETTASFPSAHVAVIVAALSVLAWWLWPRNTPRSRAWLLTTGAVLVALVAASRLYLGAHWLTDVLAGAVVGLIAAVTAIGAALSIRSVVKTSEEIDVTGSSHIANSPLAGVPDRQGNDARFRA